MGYPAFWSKRWSQGKVCKRKILSIETLKQASFPKIDFLSSFAFSACQSAFTFKFLQSLESRMYFYSTLTKFCHLEQTCYSLFPTTIQLLMLRDEWWCSIGFSLKRLTRKLNLAGIFSFSIKWKKYFPLSKYIFSPTCCSEIEFGWNSTLPFWTSITLKKYSFICL